MNNKKNDIDIFQKYLKSEEKYIKIALTDSSYKNYCEKHNLSFCDDNKNLATLGDAIIKFVYAKMLYNECKNKKYSKEIEKYITDERTGLKYELVGEYYLIAGEDEPEEDQPIGVWGQRHLRHLKRHHKVIYANLLTSGKLPEYLADIDRQAEELFLRLAKQTADAEGITEKLKASDQMEWVRQMNSIRNRAMEIVNAELIFA